MKAVRVEFDRKTKVVNNGVGTQRKKSGSCLLEYKMKKISFQNHLNIRIKNIKSTRVSLSFIVRYILSNIRKEGTVAAEKALKKDFSCLAGFKKVKMR